MRQETKRKIRWMWDKYPANNYTNEAIRDILDVIDMVCTDIQVLEKRAEKPFSEPIADYETFKVGDFVMVDNSVYRVLAVVTKYEIYVENPEGTPYYFDITYTKPILLDRWNH